MASTFENIILRLTGESDDAKNALADVAEGLAELAATDAEATLDVDNSSAIRSLDEASRRMAEFAKATATGEIQLEDKEFRAELDRIEADLRSLDGESVDATVSIDSAKALLELDKLKAQLDLLDHRSVDIDVDFQRGVVERFAALSRLTGGLAGDFEKLGETGTGAVNDIGDAAGPARAALLPLAAFIGTALVGAVFSLVSVVASAAVGLVGLGIAGVGALGPIAGLIAATVKRFNDMKGTAGTAANALQQEFKSFGDTLSKTIGPAADKVLGGLADGLKEVEPVVSQLKGPFKDLGSAMGDAIRELGDQLSSKAITNGLKNLIEGSSQLVGPVAKGIGNLGKIFLDIANGAMPLLAKVAKDVSNTLGGIAKSIKPGDVTQVLKPMIDDLGKVVQFGEQAGRAIIGLFDGAVGPGREFLKFLTDGVKSFADFASTPEGHQEIETFFQNAVTVTESLISTLVELGREIINIFNALQDAGQTIATGLAATLNPIIDVINFLTGDSIPHLATATTNAMNAGKVAAGEFILALNAQRLALIRARTAAINLGLALGKAFQLKNAADSIGGLAGLLLKLQHELQKGGKAAGDALGKALKDAVEKQKKGSEKAGSDLGDAMAKAAKKHERDAGKAGDALGKAFNKEAKAQKRAASEAGDTLGAALAKAANSHEGDMRRAGKALADAFNEAAKAQEKGASNAGDTLGKAMVKAAEAQKGAAKSAGDEVGQAFASAVEGTKAKGPSSIDFSAAIAAARSAGVQAGQAFSAAVAANSKGPSGGKNKAAVGSATGFTQDDLLASFLAPIDGLAQRLSATASQQFGTAGGGSSPASTQRTVVTGPVINQTINTLTPGDPKVHRAVAASASRGIGLQRPRPRKRVKV